MIDFFHAIDIFDSDILIYLSIKKNGKLKSKWVADLIREKIAGSWPENNINLAGAWSDLPTAEEIRGNMGCDVKRYECLSFKAS